MRKPTVFISYSHADSQFVDWLAGELKASGVDVWIDKWMIKVGDSITQKINEGISASDFLIVVLSRGSVNSKWVREELNAATIRNIEEDKHAFILPVLLEDCEILPLLQHRKYADFTDDPEQAFQELIEVLRPESPAHLQLLLYFSRTGESILMVQTWADRREWGPPYHMTKPRRALRWVLKVYGSRTHPVPDDIAEQCIQNTIENITDLDPDIVGLGGMGETARKIRTGLQEAGCRAEIGYWGADVGIDAAQFLQRVGVEPPY